jgi:pimeloyl-ACP methyl ester carboxylesterase
VLEVEAVGEPVDIVGHDWGSLLVQRLVSTRPDLVHTWAAGSATIDRDYVWHDLAQMWQTPEVGEQIMDAMAGDALVDAIASPGLVLWGADDPYVTATSASVSPSARARPSRSSPTAVTGGRSPSPSRPPPPSSNTGPDPRFLCQQWAGFRAPRAVFAANSWQGFGRGGNLRWSPDV